MTTVKYKRINNKLIDDILDDDDEIIYYRNNQTKQIKHKNKLILFLITLICGKYYTKIYNDKYK